MFVGFEPADAWHPDVLRTTKVQILGQILLMVLWPGPGHRHQVREIDDMRDKMRRPIAVAFSSATCGIIASEMSLPAPDLPRIAHAEQHNWRIGHKASVSW